MSMCAKAAEEELLGGSPDLVIDCIDNIDTKARRSAADLSLQKSCNDCLGK